MWNKRWTLMAKLPRWRLPMEAYTRSKGRNHPIWYNSDTNPHVWGIFPQHQQGVLPFNSILTLSTWKQHQVPQAEDSIRQDHPLPKGNLKPRSSPMLLTVTDLVWWGLTELRITPHILDCWFIIKDYNLGRVRWKRQARQSRWGEASASMAPATHPTSPSVAMQELSEPHSFGFSWRPHYISTIKS